MITHGRAKRRMVGYACGVAATTARARVPELIAEALKDDRAAAAAAASAASVAPAEEPA